MAWEITAATRPPIVIGATGIDEIMQNVRTILSTLSWSVPLDRAFAGGGDFLDSPSPFEAQRRMAGIVEQVETHEPRVKVTGIRFEKFTLAEHMDGLLAPVLEFTLREGVTL